MSKVKVSDIVVRSLAPNIKNAALEKLLPANLHAQSITFVLDGVNNAIANGLRRTVSCELPANRMVVEYDKIRTDDVFIIPEMIARRITMVPLLEACPTDTIFELHATNKTSAPVHIKTNALRIARAGRGSTKTHPFNENITLFTLNPGKSIDITNVTINTSHGYINGVYTQTYAAAAVALDVDPLNAYEDTGVSSSVSAPAKYRISFSTNGTADARAIVAAACANIIARVKAVGELLHTIESIDSEYVFVIGGESDTVGNLLMRTICEQYRDIQAVTYDTSTIGRTLTMRMRCDEDAQEVFSVAIERIISVYKAIHAAFA